MSAPLPSRIALALSAADPEDWGDATPEEADGYDVALDDLPGCVAAELSAGRPASRVLLALNCGTGAGGFQPNNTCAKGGYGRDHGLRTSRVTKGNITASGATKSREFTDSAGRKVTEHTTADGRVFHAVVHPSGRKSFHQIHGTVKAKAAAAAAQSVKVAEPVASPPAPSAKSDAADPKAFAAKVQAAADAVAAREGPGGKGVSNLGDKVHIAAVHAEYEKQNGPIGLDEFKAKLADTLGESYAPDLVHEDRPQHYDAASQESFARGEIRRGSSSYHYVRAGPPAEAPAETSKPSPAAPPGQFPRYRTPGGTMVQVGKSGRIIGGDAKAADLRGKMASEVGAVPEAEYYAAKAAGAKPAAAHAVTAGGTTVAVTPAMREAALASASRTPSREALAKATAKFGEGPAAREKALNTPGRVNASVASAGRVRVATEAVKAHLSRLDTHPESQSAAAIDKTVAAVKSLPKDEANAVLKNLGIAGKAASATEAARKVRNVLANQAEAAGRVQTMAEERRREPVRGFGFSAAAPPASRLALALSARGNVATPAAVVLALSAVDQRAAPGAVIDPPPGMPATKGNQKLHYRRHRIAKARPFTHMATGKREEITADRIGLWASAFDGRAAAGVYPFIYPRHLEAGEQPDARHTLGYVVGHERDAATGDWYSIEQYVGDDAARVADANGRSVTVLANGVDPDNAAYAEYVHHIALTPMAALPEAGYVPTLAASGAVVMAPVYVCDAVGCRCVPASRAALAASFAT